MQIQPSPLTVIIDPPSIQSGMPGDTLQLYVVVRNESNQGAVIDVFFDEASEILNQWCKSLRERLALAPQQSSELTFQFDIPVDALPGTYDYTLIVDAPEHFPEETPIQYPRQLKVMLKEQTAIRVKDPTFSLKPSTNPTNPAIIKSGQPLQVEVKVNNSSDRVDRFHLTCPDLEEDWFTIRYVPTGFEGSGLLSGPSGLELNPGSQGQIWLQFQPPVNTLAGSYSPTVRLHSANFPDLVLLDLVYIEIPVVHRLNVELNTIRGKVTHSSGLYEIKLTNQGNTSRELTVGIKNRDEERLYTYKCDPPQVRLLPSKNFNVNLTVKPIRWWRRPMFGTGLTFNFIVELQDRENLPLPENLPRGTLVWSPRPWWQFLLLVLGVLGLLGGLALVVWLLLKLNAPPTVDSFTTENSSYTYTEGDRVLLNWQIGNYKQLSKLELKSDGLNVSEPQDFNFNQGIPDKLKNLCPSPKQILVCNNFNTGVMQPGDYTFTLSTFPRGQDKVSSSKTFKLKINEKPAPKIISFQPDKNQYTSGEVMVLSWKIQNPDELSKLQIIGKAEGTQTVLATYNRAQLIPSPQTEDSKQTKQNQSTSAKGKVGLSTDGSHSLCNPPKNQELICTNIPLKTPQPGKYTFELQAFYKPDKPPISQPTVTTINILPRPFKIIYFKLNESQEPNIVIQNGKPVILSWKVEGEDINVELSPFGKRESSGSEKLTANQALPLAIQLIVSDKFGNKDSRGFSVKVESPPPPPSPSIPSPPIPSPKSPFSQPPFSQPPVRPLPIKPKNPHF